MSEVSRPRRTQQERRAATVAKLVDATIDAIGEVGYQRTTVQEICGRAGLSAGAMFRQFDTRLDLIVRTAEEVFARQLVGYTVTMEHLGAQDNPLDVALRFLRMAQQSNLTHALREIYLAARSDTELRERIAPIAENYYSQIAATLERTELFAEFPAGVREPLFFMLLHVFSGEAVVRGVYKRPDLDDSVLRLVEDMLAVYSARSASAAPES
ncbi:TetR/AcrR family transcriptional regulator [Nocardia seriolae]|uniref:HTH-type transcriptional regulator n=1 Tax=Nocardia seriolae TaxID=37332 RepID=A0A0B8NCV1_9NOCA|nr:TetR/AcrR family transcriptional regulator [Nocardia seriolae]APA98227.1 putative HTH-type transcriptional regulator [Nocardia seriolae]MTJ62907.1 TetR family transcriptional regulator [Nocardia seriolae]MTJ72655.1 TetR family transcriptional regulator [Nocardia seriolae]MTJ87938.1 TetR family transcriptional regulator [Nocardia seriolae]MTK31928.1 TetR family transcriptional regulator [Nocardia seriolae]